MKSLVLIFLITIFAYAQVEIVSVGRIDAHYRSELSKEELVKIIKEIERLFEAQIGFKVFEYKESGGKPIDVIYLPPSQKKRKILQNSKKALSLYEKIQRDALILQTQSKEIKRKNSELAQRYKTLNSTIERLNRSTEERNKTEMDAERQKVWIAEFSRVKSALEAQAKELERDKKRYNSKVRALKNKIDRRNRAIKRYNALQREQERISHNYIETKGITQRSIKTMTTTTTKDGIATVERETKIDAKKIEIYDFENLKRLKVILAHELGHLVGVNHIEVEGALMHPILQKEQLKELSLSYEDINAFHEAFNAK